MDKKLTGALLVGYDFSHGDDIGIVTVGVREPNGTVKIINAFQGEEAKELLKKLTTARRSDKND